MEDYLERNVAAVREVVALARPEVALANHLVMGPVVLARALAGTGIPYAVKIHGSALEYVVKPHPRFLPYGARGDPAGARRARRLAPHRREPVGGARRGRPRGEDPPRPARRRRRALRAARSGGRGRPVGRGCASGWGRAARRASGARRRPRPRASADPPATASADPSATVPRPRRRRPPPPRSPSPPARPPRALGGIDPSRDRVVVFVGKLIASKGVDLLLAAWPLVLQRVPDARLLVVGFGAFRSGLESLAQALGRGDLAAARALRAEDGRQLPELGAFLDGLRGEAARDYFDAAADLPGPRPLGGAARARRARRRAAGRRGDGGAEHVPRGVRDGGGGGGRVRRVPGRRRRTPGSPRWRARSPPPCRPRRATG